MASLFKYVPWEVGHLVNSVRAGSLALPDLQRPFVWPATKVRDFFDSMYRGYPVGQLMFWQTGAEVGARRIGSGDKSQVPTHAIVDGQQRLTSLFAVFTGEAVVREDYTEARVHIAFNPFTERFEVATPVIRRSNEWVSNITDLFQDPLTVVEDFVERVTEAKDLTREQARAVRATLTRLAGLDHYQFIVVDLDKEADEEQVAEIFVRINSEGISLNQSDFILTLMSVYWEEGRFALENFARSARTLPSDGKPTAFSWHLKPRPDEMLRVVIAVGLGRGRLKNAYSALRGRDIVTGKIDLEKREEQFQHLVAAEKDVLNLLHWTEFLKCLERAGYRSEKLIPSRNAIVYSYATWLIGRTQFNVPLPQLREIIARWFFMSSLTGRYSNSPESTVDQDLVRINDLPDREPETFITHLQSLIDSTLTNDFWTVTLPNELNTSASRSPALFGYIAALNILDSDALLSTVSIRSWLDPATISKRGLERHHLFPKKYLKTDVGITNMRLINQIANFALVEWSDNNTISAQAPTDYWPEEVDKKKPLGLNTERLAKQRHLHALPDAWPDITYEDFLTQRRTLIAKVIKDAYLTLQDPDYTPEYPAPTTIDAHDSDDSPSHTDIDLKDLLGAGILQPGTLITPKSPGYDTDAEITANATILLDGKEYGTPSGAAGALGASVNGWTFWVTETPNGTQTLNRIRKDFFAGDYDEAEETDE